ncbi:hypothetical protein [Aliterella atlantica]|uniref:Histidine kinase n=1 Tax=Aliterella atlantica CENA595 TaxID=1618023 RepID=A0A0D8ZWB1_9CYAN|nr:hypothetical protein [Aliterella atlantica]KJH72709.1 hypothetical protein UH38_06285 [Aliterella atlantica CENA595]
MLIVALAIVSVIAVLLLVALLLVVRQSKLKFQQMDKEQAATTIALQQSHSRFQQLAANIPGAIDRDVMHADGSDTSIYTSDRFWEEQTRMATEAADLGMWFWNIPQNELVWTDRCKALFGIAPTEQMTYEKFLNAEPIPLI